MAAESYMSNLAVNHALRLLKVRWKFLGPSTLILKLKLAWGMESGVGGQAKTMVTNEGHSLCNPQHAIALTL